RPILSSCDIGRTERPSTTEISTSTASIWLKANSCRQRRKRQPLRIGAMRHIESDMLAEPLTPAENRLLRSDGHTVEWAGSSGYVDYEPAVAAMEARAAAIAAGEARELIWLLEHPPLYTAGVSAKPDDLLTPDRFPVHRTGRGGQFTYHGPGQRVAYVMLDLSQRG